MLGFYWGYILIGFRDIEGCVGIMEKKMQATIEVLGPV